MSVFPFTLETLETLFTVRQESHDPYVAGCVAASRPYPRACHLGCHRRFKMFHGFCGFAKVRSCIGLYIWKPGFLCSVHLHNVLATRF